MVPSCSVTSCSRDKSPQVDRHTAGFTQTVGMHICLLYYKTDSPLCHAVVELLQLDLLELISIPLLCRTFKEIASTEGSKSMDKKKGLIQKLVVGSRQNETGYIMRALQGKLRIGLAEQTVLVALAHAVLLHRQGDKDKDSKLAGQLEEASQAVKYVYSQCPSYDQLVPALLHHPVSVSPLILATHQCTHPPYLDCLCVFMCFRAWH